MVKNRIFYPTIPAITKSSPGYHGRLLYEKYKIPKNHFQQFFTTRLDEGLKQKQYNQLNVEILPLGSCLKTLSFEVGGLLECRILSVVSTTTHAWFPLFCKDLHQFKPIFVLMVMASNIGCLIYFWKGIC